MKMPKYLLAEKIDEVDLNRFFAGILASHAQGLLDSMMGDQPDRPEVVRHYRKLAADKIREFLWLAIAGQPEAECPEEIDLSPLWEVADGVVLS